MSLVFKVLIHKIEASSSKRGVIWVPGIYIYTHLKPQVMYIHTQYPTCCRHIPTFGG